MAGICDGSSWQHPVAARTVAVGAGSACPGSGKLPATSGRTRPARPTTALRRPSPGILRRSHHPHRSGIRTPWWLVTTPAIYPDTRTCAPTRPLINFSHKTTIVPRKRRAARGACVLCRREPREGSQPHNWMSRDYIKLCRLQMVSDPNDSFCQRREPRARPTWNRMISLIQ